MRNSQNFWDKNAGRYDRFMRKDTAAYEQLYELLRPVVRQKTVLELATADSADGAEDYQAVLLQRGTADTYPDFIDDSEKDLKQAYGIIKPRTANITVEGAEVTAVRCDIQTYYAVLATITYDSGDVVYVSALTKLASINDIVNLVESVSLS